MDAIDSGFVANTPEGVRSIGLGSIDHDIGVSTALLSLSYPFDDADFIHSDQLIPNDGSDLDLRHDGHRELIEYRARTENRVGSALKSEFPSDFGWVAMQQADTFLREGKRSGTVTYGHARIGFRVFAVADIATSLDPASDDGNTHRLAIAAEQADFAIPNDHVDVELIEPTHEINGWTVPQIPSGFAASPIKSFRMLADTGILDSNPLL